MFHFLRISFFCCLLLSLSSSVQAHRLYLAAFVDGKEIVADSRFSRSTPGRGIPLQVFNDQDGSLLLEGKTDEQGSFRFPIPPQALEHPVDLRLIVDAGDGHRAEWVISASEISSQQAVMSVASAEEQSKETDQQATSKKEKTGVGLEITEQRLKEIIDSSLDARLAPIRTMLMAQQADGPGFLEIVGGIGWIFGVFGLAAFVMSRKTNRPKGD